MSDVFRNGRFEPDDWVVLDAATADDAASPVVIGAKFLVPLLRWREERRAIEATAAAVGLLLAGDDPIEVLGEEVHRFPVIAIRFPAFTDGRGYSLARLLRERRRFAGELRAIGDVLADQIPLMWRCGFDALAVTHEPTRAALAAGRVVGLPLHMQPTGISDPSPVAARPWLRAAYPAQVPNFAGC